MISDLNGNSYHHLFESYFVSLISTILSSLPKLCPNGHETHIKIF